MAATPEEPLPQRWLLVSLYLVLSAPYTCDSKHVLLRKVGWQSSRSLPDRQVLPPWIRKPRSLPTLSAHASNDTPAVAQGHRPSLLIDCEEDRTLRAVLVGMLREG